jgi:hypothetical protein
MHDVAMVEPADDNDHIRVLAISVKICYVHQNTPLPPPVHHIAPLAMVTSSSAPLPTAAFSFLAPQRPTAMFGSIHVHYDVLATYRELA